MLPQLERRVIDIASTDAVQSVHVADVKSTRFLRRKTENQGVDSEERAVVSTSAINKALKNLGLADDTVLKNLLSKGDVETFLTNSKGVQKVVVNTNGVKKTFTNFDIDLLRDMANPAVKKQISAWHVEGLKLKDIPVKLRADKIPKSDIQWKAFNVLSAREMRKTASLKPTG